MTNSFSPPFLGAAYYPELWPAEEQPRDIARMQELGMNVMRMGEFAWAFLEPEEGRYEFDWLRRSVDRLAEAGIASVLCTPTATPPIWLTDQYPETLAVAEDGQPYAHGSRRHYCWTSPVYREHSRRITAALAKAFGDHEAVLAWQLDNEFGCHINACYCPACREGFHRFLEAVYGNIETLNQRWGTGVWSQRYQRFDQIPLPVKTPYGHHPSLRYQYRRFMSRSMSDFAREQAATLRKRTTQPITTNAMPPWHKIDYADLYADLDFASNDLYADPDNLWTMGAEFDWMRTKKDRPFWLMETSATWGGALEPGAVYVHHPGALRAKCWWSFALGGEAVVYWLWRAQWSGQEMEHGSVLYAWGEPTLARVELKALRRDLDAAGEFLRTTRVAPASAAVHFSYPALWQFDIGRVAPGLDYTRCWNEYYRLFLDHNIHRAVIFPDAVVDGYRAVFSPFLATVDDDLRERMERFVRDGGTWVVGPLSGFRTEDATAFQGGCHGPLEELVGASVRHRFPPAPGGAALEWEKTDRAGCSLWCDAFRGSAVARVIARYVDGPAAGSPAVIERQLGAGRILTLGTLPDARRLGLLLESACAADGVPGPRPGRGINVVPRVFADGSPAGCLLVDIAGRGGSVAGIPRGVNLLTGEAVEGSLSLRPWDVAVVRYAREDE